MSTYPLPDTLVKSSLWKKTFGPSSPPDPSVDKTRDFYSGQLLLLRDRAKDLVSRIQSVFPQLTIHDITHLDALWEIASLIAGPKYPALTPAEGFVFGAAVLLHDAAMSLAAYPRGLDELRATTLWRDVVSMLLRAKNDATPTPEQIDNPSDEIRDIALFRVVRNLHAEQAEKLPASSHGGIYLIDNPELRHFYGTLIGKIARSHGEPLTYIEDQFHTPRGPCTSHNGGQVNAKKLALLLRCADACQIDGRRAPLFQQRIVKPDGLAKLHWDAQSKLAIPQAVGDTLVFTSAQEFTAAEADAWWVGYDLIQVADRELRQADRLIADLENNENKFDRFQLNRVKGADSPIDLSRIVQTAGWKPVDASVRISNISRIVEMFGGEKLYGDDKSVVLRELLQNAADAVRALRKLGTAEDPRDGEITVKLREADGYHWLDVIDTGIGMSHRTMTETLLDFGKSFWASDSVHTEFPGLMASGLTPSGKFGIGFFSIFMVADYVTVTSRRFDHGHDQTRTLEFRDRLNLRPILRNPNPRESLASYGTRVSLRLSQDPYREDGFLCDWAGERAGRPVKHSLKLLVGYLCPCLDVSVWVIQNGQRERVLKAGDWRTIAASSLIARIKGVDSVRSFSEEEFKRIRPLVHGDWIYGRAALLPLEYINDPGSVVCGGFRVGVLDDKLGVLEGEVETLDRTKARITVPTGALATWATEQAKLAGASNYDDDNKMSIAHRAWQFGGDTGKLPIVKINGISRNQDEVATFLASRNSLLEHFLRPCIPFRFSIPQRSGGICFSSADTSTHKML